MTTRKHEVEEGMQDDRAACMFCNEREPDSICDKCARVMCVECGVTDFKEGVLCPLCANKLMCTRKGHQWGRRKTFGDHPITFTECMRCGVRS